MKFSALWANLNVLAEFLLGGGEKRTVTLSCEGESLTLPITPWKYSVTTAQNNKTVDILDSGEALLFGNEKLSHLKFSCFFPNQDGHEGHKYIMDSTCSPQECIDLIKKWKAAKKPVRVIITDSPVNLMMGIMNFDYNEKDGSRDIYYEISFEEYRDLNTPAANNDRTVDEATGLKDRPVENQTTISTEVNKQANLVNSRQTNGNGGIPLSMTGGYQAPHGCFGDMTNASQSSVKGISNARDALEVSKSAYGDYKKLQTLKDKNNLQHLALINIRNRLQGKAFQI